MKTNVPITLTDDERDKLANIIAGKPNKKLASRRDVVAICQQHIAGLVGSIDDRNERERVRIMVQHAKPGTGVDLYRADPEDIPLMARPNDPGYVRGWNLVKRGAA